MIMIWAFGERSPKTVWVAFFQRSQARQSRAARRKLASDDAPLTKKGPAVCGLFFAFAACERPFGKALMSAIPIREPVALCRFFLGHFRAFFPGFREANRYGLLTALNGAALSALA